MKRCWNSRILLLLSAMDAGIHSPIDTRQTRIKISSRYFPSTFFIQAFRISHCSASRMEMKVIKGAIRDDSGKASHQP